MKKILSLAASAVLSVSILVGCGSSAGLKDGKYTGEGTGNNGPIVLSVTVKDGKISEVVVDSEEETDGIWEGAIESISKAAVGKTSTDGIDTVSEATNSSKGILEAIDAALAKAK